MGDSSLLLTFPLLLGRAAFNRMSRKGGVEFQERVVSGSVSTNSVPRFLLSVRRLVDIAPALEGVDVQGSSVNVHGISAKGLAGLLGHIRNLRMIMTGKEVRLDCAAPRPSALRKAPRRRCLETLTVRALRDKANGLDQSGLAPENFTTLAQLLAA
jgi:hypothetical protein